jgi:hypothetical protein
VPLLVLHDFGKAGLSIAATLGRDTRRYQFEDEINIIDIGLRLDDVRALGLEGAAESTFDRGSSIARQENLKANGATDDEVRFLLERRVELNALPSDELVAFIERKLTEHGVAKVVPDDDMLAETYRAFKRGQRPMSILGHKSATSLRIYTKGASQRKLATAAIIKLEQTRNKTSPTRSFKFGELPKRTGNTAG